MQEYIEVFINEKSHKIVKGLTIIQACEEVGIQLPRFCYHEQLSIAGNCRMCLVELENSVKPIASCALTVESNMKIFTNTILVKKAREAVMEFLLINHPLDCPICDQGGECDLQDQAMLFGNDRGRFYEVKRAVSALELGPFVKTVMTRCIHCTRCVRFLTELGGYANFGTTGRGNNTEIGSYVFNVIDSEVSGNIIDLCPVGALTSKPYAFTVRPWELTKIESIDTLDSMGSNISYHVYGENLMRILPVMHMGINEEWVADKTRFSYDGFMLQRLTIPLFLKNKKYFLIEWYNVFSTLIDNIEKPYFFLLNNHLSMETLYSIKNLKNKFNKIDYYLKDSISKREIDFRNLYLFNSTYLQLKQTDFCCIIGCNLKKEMPLLLLKLRKEKRARNLAIYVFGGMEKYNLSEKSIGLNMNNLLKFREGKHFSSAYLKKASLPLLIVGSTFLNSINGNTIINMFMTLKQFNKKNWQGVNFIELGSGNIAAYELGIKTLLKKQKSANIFNFNVHLDLTAKNTNFKLFLGTHGDDSLINYNMILPINSAIENNSIYLNNEGRSQMTKIVINGPKQAKIDWKIVGQFFDNLFNKKEEVTSSLSKLREKYNTFYNLNLNLIGYVNFSKIRPKKQKLYNIPLTPFIISAYSSNVIFKNSRILLKAKNFFFQDIYK